MKKWKIGALTLGLALAGSAQAGGFDWDAPGSGYVELGGGIATYDNYCHQVNGLAKEIEASLSSMSFSNSQQTRADCDRRGSGFKATLGAHITSHVFGELFYMGFGTSNSHLDYSLSNNGTTADEKVSITLKGYAYGGEIGWLQTFGPVGVYIKGGESLAKLENKGYVTATTSGVSGQSSAQGETHDRNFAPIASLGGIVHIWNGLSLTVNYDRLFNVGKSSETPTTDISLYTAGLRYEF